MSYLYLLTNLIFLRKNINIKDLTGVKILYYVVKIWKTKYFVVRILPSDDIKKKKFLMVGIKLGHLLLVAGIDFRVIHTEEQEFGFMCL